MLGLMKFEILILLLLSIDEITVKSLSRTVRVRHQSSSEGSREVTFSSNGIAEEQQSFDDSFNRCDDAFDGDTYRFLTLQQYLRRQEIGDNQWLLEYDSGIRSLFGNQVLVSALRNINQLLSVTLSFYSVDGDLLNDDYGQPIEYTSNPHDLGHILDIFHQDLLFSYARFLLKLQPQSTLNLHQLLFHFSSRPFCAILPRSPKNRWLSAGKMRQPRIYFTANYLPANQSILIIGGTANGNRPLASIEIYDVSSGCSKQANMLYARMKHTATYDPTRNALRIVGGQGMNLDEIAVTELVTIDETKASENLTAPRYFHGASSHSQIGIVIFAGRGRSITENNTIENFTCGGVIPHPRVISSTILYNVEGHSVTSFGETNNVLIIGGYNGSVYPEIAYKWNGSNLVDINHTNAITENLCTRAHHQATYIPSLDAVLVTGGENGTHVLSSWFLVNNSDNNVTYEGEMRYRHSFHAAVLLANHSVLVIGGATEMRSGSPANPTVSVERFDPHTKNFTVVQSMNVASYGHLAVRTVDDEVFIMGGIGSDNRILNRIEYIMCYSDGHMQHHHRGGNNIR